MNFARALVRDLVDKRLWPVAALLVVALIAIPLLLAGGASTDSGSPVPAAAIGGGTSAGGSKSALAVELVGPPSVRSRPGKVRNPFRRAKAKVVDTAAGAPPASSPTTSTANPPAAATGTYPTPAIPATSTPTPFTYRTKVRFGSTDGGTAKARGISRLTPLGVVTDPALLYLGVSPDGKHAAFLLGPNAQQNGDGRCVDKGCRIKILGAGDSMVVDVTPTVGAPRQYTLDVISVKRADMSSERLAKKARAHVNPDGRDVLRELIRDRATAQAIDKIVYVRSSGALATKTAP